MKRCAKCVPGAAAKSASGIFAAMRVVLDTNVLVSALLSPFGWSALIFDAWEERKFTLLICKELSQELRATLRKRRLAVRIKPAAAGHLVNQVMAHGLFIQPIEMVSRSPDPNDDYLLGLAEAGRAHYLVSGDKKGLLLLRRHKQTRIVSPEAFVRLLG